MLATFMEVLDTSVANVSLPHIAGSLAASNDEAIWVLTSYLAANAVVLPMTGWLAMRFGRKRFLTICIVLFTSASALCGAANSLVALILARLLQGAAGGALQPMSQAILLESFPRKSAVRGCPFSPWVWWWRRSLVRPWEVGSPTTIRGGGFSISICLWRRRRLRG